MAEVAGITGELMNVFRNGEDGSAIVFAEHLVQEAQGGILLEQDFFVGAETGVHHQGDVDGLLRLLFEDFDLLLDALFEKLERFAREIGRGAIVIVQNAGENIYEINADADAAALLRGLRGGIAVGGIAIGRVAAGGIDDRRRRVGCG